MIKFPWIVTISGADDDVSLLDMMKLSEQYTFLEWGILSSSKRAGGPRYPSQEWMYQLKLAAASAGILRSGKHMRLSVHFCGDNAKRAMTSGRLSAMSCFGRIQINGFKATEASLMQAPLEGSLDGEPREIILQTGNEHELAENLAYAVQRQGTRISILIDASGGRGTPAQWFPDQPTEHPLAKIAFGYAGGLGPDNVEQMIDTLSAKGRSTWIDMETGVRTSDNKLDLDKVKAVLDKVSRRFSV